MGEDPDFLEKKYKYFSDNSVITRLSVDRLHRKMAESKSDTMFVPPPEKPAWTLADSEMASTDKYYYFGGYIPAHVNHIARGFGKNRPAIDGPQTFTGTDWDALLKRRIRTLSLEREMTGARPPPLTTMNTSYLNWTQEAESRRAQKEGRQPKPDPKPERPAWMKGEETRQPLSRNPFYKLRPVEESEKLSVKIKHPPPPTLARDSNSVGAFSEQLAHIFPNGHVTYDKLLKQPWKYNDEMRITGTTHTSYPIEMNC
jgi:hypothetical protein